MDTSKSAALAAIPEVMQPAKAASIVSAAVAAASTPPRPAGASIVTKKRRVGGVAALPSTSCVPTSTRALTPRCQVERSFTVRLPSAGFSRTFRSSSFMPSTSTSFSPSAMAVLLVVWAVILGLLWGAHHCVCLEELGDEPCGAVRPVERYLGGMDRLAQVFEHGRAQGFRTRAVVVESDPGAETIEPARHVELLLEVVAQRKVEERSPERSQLHGRGEAALNDREIDGGVMLEEIRHEGAHLDARAPRGLHLREPRTAHENEARLGNLRGDQGEGLRALAKETPPHPRSPHRGEDDALVGAVAQLRAQGGAVGEGPRVEVEGVPGEAEVLPRPLPHVREVGAELAIEHVLLVAHQEGQVAHVGMEAKVVDVLRVLLPTADELGRRAVLPHGEHADEVGEEGVGCPLEIRILVEEVVEIPALVADPEIVALALHHVGEGHEVRREDLVHVPQRVEGVELVIGRPALEVLALVLEEARSGMQPFPPVADDAVGGVGGEEVDDDLGMPLAEPPGDGEIALDVPEPDRAREPEHAPLALPGGASGRRRRCDDPSLGGGRDGGLGHLATKHEIANEMVDLHGVAAEEAVAAAVEGDETRSGNRRHHLLGMGVRHDLVVRSVQGEGGDANLAEQVEEVDPVDGPQ